MKSKYPTARTTRRAQKLEAELEVIGKPAPATLEVEEWLQGQGEVSLANGKPTLLVFWEVWCPHCKEARTSPPMRVEAKRSPNG